MKAVVFDFGGVMTTVTLPERARKLAGELGLDWAGICRGYDRYRHDYDGGFMTIEEMYEKIWADEGMTVTQEQQTRMIEEDLSSFLYQNVRTLAWMRTLKEQGMKIGILTNMSAEASVLFREHFKEFFDLADAVVISGFEHMYKPQRQIFDLLCERIGLPAGELLFVDDVEENCEGARRAGWQAIRFVSNDQVESDFRHGLWR